MAITKEQIIEAIRRVAKEDGVVPGRVKFESATGISQKDWLYRFWESWGQACQEAGFAPNRLNAPKSEDEVVEALARLAREKGRFPTATQLRMKAKAEPDFPSHTTFTNRLGNRSSQIRKLLEFCSRHSGYEDVAALCASEAVTDDSAPVEPDETPDVATDGYVYLLKSGKRYKLGFTKELERRFAELSHQTAEPIKVVHAFRTDDPSGIEAYWKNRFREKRVHNEWFNLSARDVAAFRRRRTFM